jgi:cation:H+ antiporter
MSILSVVFVLGGMAVLVVGAEALVRGASRLAAAAGVSSLVIGLTVVAFGTSAPELAVSVQSALSGAGEVAIGNAIGSNIFNMLAILGISALFGGLVVHRRIVRVDVPILLGVTALTWWLAADGLLSIGEGALLLAGIVGYTALAYVLGRNDPEAIEDAGAGAPEASGGAVTPAGGRTWPKAVGLVLVGLAALVAGAQLLVSGATAIAADLGVSDLMIGLTIVAAGTSLPELATSVVATRRGERDIAVGNIIGSNVFNLLAVLGASAVVSSGLPVPAASVSTDWPVALLVTVLALPILAIGLSVTRWEGGLLVAGYVAYVAYLSLDATGSSSAPGARLGLFAGRAAATVLVVVVGGLMARRGSPVQQEDGARP